MWLKSEWIRDGVNTAICHNLKGLVVEVLISNLELPTIYFVWKAVKPGFGEDIMYISLDIP